MSFLPPPPPPREIAIAVAGGLSLGLLILVVTTALGCSPLLVLGMIVIWGTAAMVLILIELRRRHVRQSR